MLKPHARSTCRYRKYINEVNAEQRLHTRIDAESSDSLHRAAADAGKVFVLK